MKNAFFFALFLLGISCNPSASAQAKIDAVQLEKMMAKSSKPLLIDLRTDGELAQTGRIDGAKQINFNSPDFAAQLEKLDKTQPVIVYCAAGGRSPRAAEKMKNMGFTNVFDYSGGMNDWLAKGKKTVR